MGRGGEEHGWEWGGGEGPGRAAMLKREKGALACAPRRPECMQAAALKGKRGKHEGKGRKRLFCKTRQRRAPLGVSSHSVCHWRGDTGDRGMPRHAEACRVMLSHAKACHSPCRVPVRAASRESLPAGAEQLEAQGTKERARLG